MKKGKIFDVFMADPKSELNFLSLWGTEQKIISILFSIKKEKMLKQ